MKERWRLGLRRWLRRAGIACTVCVPLLLAGGWLLPRWSAGEAETPTVDAIFLTAFDPRLRTGEYAVALYRQGLAKKVACLSNAITCDIFPADYARQHLIALGVPAADALVVHTPDTDCRAQLFEPTLKFAQANGWRRILWVVDPAGSRMMRNVLQPKFKATGIELYVSYPPAAREELLDGWWRSHWKVQRLAYDVLGTSLDLFYRECW